MCGDGCIDYADVSVEVSTRAIKIYVDEPAFQQLLATIPFRGKKSVTRLTDAQKKALCEGLSKFCETVNALSASRQGADR